MFDIVKSISSVEKYKMNTEIETGRYLHKRWKQLPDLQNCYEEDKSISEKVGAVVDNFPKLDESVSQALHENIINLEDIAEVVLQVYEKAQKVLLGRNQFFKNEQDHIMHVGFEIEGAYHDQLMAENGVLTEQLYEETRPIVRFFPDINSAQSFGRNLDIDIGGIPDHYFW